MKKEFVFFTCLSNGKKGEKQVLCKLYELYSENWDFEYVGDNKIYQDMDIDILMTNKYNGESISLEIKTDYTYYNNIFAEFLSSEEFKTLGCFVKSESDYIIYYFINKGKMYIMPTLQLKEIMYDSEWNIARAFDKVKTKDGFVKKTSVGYLIPIKDILEKINLKGSIFDKCEVIL